MKYLLISMFLVLISCKEINTKNDKYEIINLISNETVISLKERGKYIPKPPNNNIKDSIYKQINPFYNKEKTITIAVYPFFLKGNSKPLIHCLKYKDLYNKFTKINNSKTKIDFKKIRIDSAKIILFTEKMLNSKKKDFILMGFDVLLQFSDIAFSEDNSKAVVICSQSTSTLAGQSNLYFLEKINDMWKIKCIETVSIL